MLCEFWITGLTVYHLQLIFLPTGHKGKPATFDGLTPDEQVAYDRLKEALVSPLFLAFSKLEGRYIIDKDSCNEQVGCVLLQVHPDGTDHPVKSKLQSLRNATFVGPVFIILFNGCEKLKSRRWCTRPECTWAWHCEQMPLWFSSFGCKFYS